MITKTSDIQELNKILRQQLILQSELTPNQVMNGVSIHGQDLIERINQYAYKSYELTDSFIVFILNSRESSNDMSQVREDGTIKSINSYQLHVYVYGLSAQTLANKITSRLRTEFARLDLQQKGVYVASVSNPITGNEFINNTLMIRCDFFVDVSVEMTIEQVSQAQDLELGEIIIEEV